LDGAEVESVGAGAFLVLVHRIARHLTHLAHRVVELARVNVEVIGSNILEGEEATILCDWEFSCFQEVIQLIYCPLGWIIHEVLEEVQERFMRKSITHEVEDSFGQSVVNDLSMIVDRTILDLNIGSIEEGLNLLADIDDVDKLIPVLLSNCIKCLLVFRMIGFDNIGLSVDDSGNSAPSNDDC
jgi:hypothetical protein